MSACGCLTHERTPELVDAAELFSGLPACGSDEGDGSLDLLAGCAGAVCVGQTYDDWVAALGRPVCDPPSKHDEIECAWGGLSSEFDDEDHDGVVDPKDRGDEVRELLVTGSYRGRTSDGLGAGVPVRCFVDALGDPTSAVFELQPDGTYFATTVEFDAPELELEDGDGDAPVDGLVDAIRVSAP